MTSLRKWSDIKWKTRYQSVQVLVCLHHPRANVGVWGKVATQYKEEAAALNCLGTVD